MNTEIIKALEDHIVAECSPTDNDALYQAMLQDCYPQTVNVCGMEMDAVRVFREMDETAYDCGCNDYMDSLLRDGEITEEINGANYRKDEAEKARDEFVSNLELEKADLEQQLEDLQAELAELEDDNSPSADQDEKRAEIDAKQKEIDSKEAEIEACQKYEF